MNKRGTCRRQMVKVDLPKSLFWPAALSNVSCAKVKQGHNRGENDDAGNDH